MEVFMNNRMGGPNIQLEISRGNIETEIQTEETEIELRELKMQLERALRQVELITNFPQLEIDLADSRIEMGLKPSNIMRKESAQKAKQIAQEYVARKARQGDELARIEDEEMDPLITQAVEEALQDAEVNIASIPDTPPLIELIPGEIDLDMVPEEIEIRMEERIRTLYFEQQNINFYLSSPARLDVMVE